MSKIPLTVVLATLVGALFRFWNLSVPPLWIDEALLANGYLPRQEFIGNLLLTGHSDFLLRFPYALAGTMTIPAVYYVLKDKKVAEWASWIVAVLPLLVFWSRLARPYALAGLFVVVAWRWWWVMIPAMFCTPAALLGVRLRRGVGMWLMLIGLAIMLYFIRSDVSTGKDFLNIDFILNNPRIWYVPILASILYISDYGVPFVLRNYPRFFARESE